MPGSGEPKGVDTEKKERRVSRFKVSVVTEPDQSKLTIPEKKDNEEVVKAVKEEEGAEKGPDVASVINESYKSLEKAVASIYSVKPGKKEFCYIFYLVRKIWMFIIFLEID